MRPKIGITFGKKPNRTDEEYLEAVRKAGGEPFAIRPGEAHDTDFDGLILSGGQDVDPAFYGEKIEPFCEEIDRKRDEFEFELTKKFVARGKPVFAICRGIQVLNVAMGGTLYQDLQRQLKGELFPAHLDRRHLSREEKRALRHPVHVKKGSALHGLLGEKVEANSRHHQAVKDVAPDFRVAAESTDGVIEAIESAKYPKVMAVEWHPESREVYPDFEILFKAFVSNCIETINSNE